MSEFVRVIAVSDLPEGRGTEVAVKGKPVALYNVGGSFHAIGNTCPHRGGPLGLGFLESREVTCPWHGWTFDVTTGLNTVNDEMKVPRYEVKVEDGQVLVSVD
jgi:nitrite reductase/ring-hydroxylating ferredoxin subunit